MYTISEIFYSLQGEGCNTGTAAVFCRFAGCNLACPWCDTDYRRTASFSDHEALTQAINHAWTGASTHSRRLVILTGGEPALQTDPGLVRNLHKHGFRVAIETAGTLPLPVDLDWVCVSPKAGAPLALRSADELKLVWPQEGIHWKDFEDGVWGQLWLQPMDGPDREVATAACVKLCMQRPWWRLSQQTQKFGGFR